MPCFQINYPLRERQEVTAQVKALKELAARRGQTLTPGPSGALDSVQWEVTRKQFGRDLSGNRVTTPGYRIDIAVNDPGEMGLLEVRRWVSDPVTRTPVDNRLNLYRSAMTGLGITAVRDDELNVAYQSAPFSWVRAYVNPRGTVSCVWGDDVPGHPGNVYFTEAADRNLPPEIRPVCLNPDKQRQLQTDNDAKDEAYAAAMKGILDEAARNTLAAAGAVVFDVAEQETGFDCYAVYYVTVAMSAVAATTLRMDYGDGGPKDEVQIPQGTGTFTAGFTHAFRQGSFTAAQTATIVGTHLVATALTHHDPHNLVGPIQLGSLAVSGNDGTHEFGAYANTTTVWGLGTLEGGDEHVDPTVSYMRAGMRSSSDPGAFTIATGTDEDGGWRLPDGDYDVRFFNGDDADPAYSDHSARNVPAGNCITSPTTAPPQVTRVGRVTVSGGQIIAASDELGSVVPVTAPGSNVPPGTAGPFSVPGEDRVNSVWTPREQAVCLASLPYGEVGIQGPISAVSEPQGSLVAMENYVGLMKVYGNRSDSQTVTVTGHDEFDAPSEAGVQSVSPEMARADAGVSSSTRWFKVWTGPDPATGWELATGTYEVNLVNVGYSDHFTLSNSCATWTVPSTAVNLGTVHITDGTIDGAAGTYNLGYASNWAQFKMFTTVANSGTQEAGVCISDQVGTHNGNQAPLQLV